MPELPPSSSTASFPEGSAEHRLQQGLMALKQKDYVLAIQRLSNLPQLKPASNALRLKARMGLIQALRGNGQIAEAITWCQPLAHHHHPKVQQWATETLARLEAIADKQPEITLAQRSSESASAAAPQPPENPPPENPSGFQPLNWPENEPQPSGFVPLSGTPGSGTLGSPASSSPIEATSSPPEPVTISPEPLTEVSPEDNSAPSSGSQTSLFHYEHLNNRSLPADITVQDTFTVASREESSHNKAELPPPPQEESREPDVPPPWQLRYAGRLENLRTLPVNRWAGLQGWGIQGITLVVLVWVWRIILQGVLTQTTTILATIDRLVPVPLGWQFQGYTILTLMGLVGLLLASPWLLDWLLKHAYNQKSLAIQTLKKSHPEACRLLRRVGQQRGWLLPALRVLPTDAPVMFSYGWLPRYGRVVISQGVLKRLDDSELATLMGYELVHFTAWTLPLMSLMTTLLQLLYQSYWQLAQWGDRHANRWLKSLAAVMSALSYTIYWLMRKIGIPLSRTRVYPCDRQAVEWTGNPNALVRALIKLETGIADTVSQRGYTPPLLESTDLLTPYGYEAAISLGSLYPDPAFPRLLSWDTQNPYRHWLSLNSSHPLLGERLKRLTEYARRWQLEPEVQLPMPTAQISLRSQAAFWEYWLPFLQQISPYIGPFIGVVVTMALWFLGGVFRPLGVWQISWFYGDQSLLMAGIWIGLGIGIMLRINRYFPDITAGNRLTSPSLVSLLQRPMALPTDSKTIALEGILLGRRGIANWFCQDLILSTSTGLIKLHLLSSLGAFGNFFIHPQHPTNWVSQKLKVQGWFRRGAIAWLDVDHMSQSGKVVARSNHPIWSVVLSLTACALGLYTVFQG